MNRNVTPDSTATERWLIGAQLLILIVLAMGLQFLIRTTGGTLFLFATVAPVLVAVSILILAGVLIARFRRRHSLFHMETYEPGQIVFRQGDAGECAYFIQSGEVEVLRDHEEDGRQSVIAKLSRGQYFGEMALLSDAPRNATIRASTATKLAVLGKRNFLTMMGAVRTVQEDIMKTVQQRAMKETQ